jgi:hypothetical protein
MVVCPTTHTLSGVNAFTPYSTVAAGAGRRTDCQPAPFQRSTIGVVGAR